VEPVARVWDIIAPGLRWWGWTSTHSEPLPSRTPLAVEIRLCTRSLHRCDVDNLAKAVLDAMNGIVYPDDRWIDDLHIRREVGEPGVVVIVKASGDKT